MFHHLRRRLDLAVVLVCLLPSALAVNERSISAAPGTLVRWSAPGTTRCAMKGRAWAALHGTCYYPIDLLQKPAMLTAVRWRSGVRQYARISVEPVDYGVEEIQ